jgi:ABC-2 type transport system permease protein
MPAMKTKFLRETNAVITLAMRDITLFLKSPAKIIQSFIMPIMFLGMFGGQLSQNMGRNMGFDFNVFMLVGMLVQGLFMIMGNGITSLVEDRGTDFTQEILVSPVSRYSIILGKIVGSAFAGYITFFFTIIIGYCIGARLNISQLLTLLAFSPLVMHCRRFSRRSMRRLYPKGIDRGNCHYDVYHVADFFIRRVNSGESFNRHYGGHQPSFTDDLLR